MVPYLLVSLLKMYSVVCAHAGQWSWNLKNLSFLRRDWINVYPLFWECLIFHPNVIKCHQMPSNFQNFLGEDPQTPQNPSLGKNPRSAPDFHAGRLYTKGEHFVKHYIKDHMPQIPKSLKDINIRPSDCCYFFRILYHCPSTFSRHSGAFFDNDGQDGPAKISVRKHNVVT